MQSILHNWHDNGGNNWPAMSLINCTLCRVSRFSAIFAFPLVFRYSPPDRSLARGRVVVSRARTASRNLIYRYAGWFIKASARADICIPHATGRFNVSVEDPTVESDDRAYSACGKSPCRRIIRLGGGWTLETRPSANRSPNCLSHSVLNIVPRTLHHAWVIIIPATYSNHVGTLGCALTRSLTR